MNVIAHDVDQAFADVGEGADRRSSPRTTPVFRVVKVSRGVSEGLARCLDISDGGAKIETQMPLCLGDAVWIEISPDTEVSGRVVWTSSNEFGVAFDGGIDCERELRHAARQKWSERARSPRLKTAMTARVNARGIYTRTTIGNISQEGMLVSHGGEFHAGLSVKVLFQNGAEKRAVVRWTKDGFAGLYLYDSFDVMELGDLTALSRANDDEIA